MIVSNASEWEQVLKRTEAIEKLTFATTEFLEFGDLVTVLRLSPSLIELRLERCFHVSNIILQSLADYTPFLENLFLSGCLLSDANLHLLAHTCKNLKKVDFSCTNMTMNALLILMESSPWLEEVDLSEIQILGNIPDKIPPLVFPSILKSINLRNTAVNDLILKHIATNSPQLQVLILEDCVEITDLGVMKVASCCLNLETLDLSFCSKITDLSVQAFAIQANKHVSRLKEVHLSACELITPATIHQFIRKCGKLELLVLDGCEKMNNTLINEYATIKDEISCTLERKELLQLMQIPIQIASFQISGTLEVEQFPKTNSQSSAIATLTRQKSKSIMASASTGAESVELAFAERAERIKQNRLSRGTKNNSTTEPTEIDQITGKGRKLAMRRSMSASSAYKSRFSEEHVTGRLLENLRLRSNTVSQEQPDAEKEISHQEPFVRAKKSGRPRPITIMAGSNFSNQKIDIEDTVLSTNVNINSPSSLSSGSNPSATKQEIRSIPFSYSREDRGRFLTKLKVEITKGSFQELILHEKDDPSQLASNFCKYYGNTSLAESLARMLIMRKNNALRRMK